jgi:hypothetical protein
MPVADMGFIQVGNSMIGLDCYLVEPESQEANRLKREYKNRAAEVNI